MVGAGVGDGVGVGVGVGDGLGVGVADGVGVGVGDGDGVDRAGALDVRGTALDRVGELGADGLAEPVAAAEPPLDP